MFDPGALEFGPRALVFNPGALVFNPGALVFNPGALEFRPNALVVAPALLVWDCVPRVCRGGGGCAGGGVPLGAVPVLSWCGEVSPGGIQSSSLVFVLTAQVWSRSTVRSTFQPRASHSRILCRSVACNSEESWVYMYIYVYI